jgi:hypothetical protein
VLIVEGRLLLWQRDSPKVDLGQRPQKSGVLVNVDNFHLQLKKLDITFSWRGGGAAAEL